MASSDFPENTGCGINGAEISFKCSNIVEPSVEDDNDEEMYSDTENTKGEIDWSLLNEDFIMTEFKKNKKKSNFFIRWIKCLKLVEPSNEDDSVEDKIKSLRDKMDSTIEELKSSRLYHEILHQWKNNSEFQSNIDRVLNNNNLKIPMVIYALGSIESSYRSRYQLALAILLKHDFPNLISGIESYDPVTSRIDTKVMEDLGINVLTYDECGRKIEKPTLFYTPFALHAMEAELLDANWCPSGLNQLILLTTSFEDTMKHWREVDDEYQRKPTFCEPDEFPEYYEVRECVDFVEAIQKHTVEIPITSHKHRNSYTPLDFSWHFFNLGSDLDMAPLLTAVPGRKMRLKIKRRRSRQNKLQKFWEVALNSCHIR